MTALDMVLIETLWNVKANTEIIFCASDSY